jgi:hypothetical protein
LAALFLGLLSGCSGAHAGTASAAIAPIIPVTLEFDGEVLAPADEAPSDEVVRMAEAGADSVRVLAPERQVQAQMLWALGQLNGDHAVAQLDALTLSNVSVDDGDHGSRHITYHAKLPVAWDGATPLPASYDVVLPRDLRFDAQDAFYATFGGPCGAPGASAGSFWYQFRPRANGCTLTDDHAVRATASVVGGAAPVALPAPQYARMWEDGALEVVAVFNGSDAAGAADARGVAAYTSFVQGARAALGPSARTTPASLPDAPSGDTPDVTLESDLDDGRHIRIVALLVDNVRTTDAAFDARLGSLSRDADVVAYAGDPGLGANVRALAHKVQFQVGKYQIFFFDACDPFSYVDGSLAEARAKVDADAASQLLDVLTQAQPALRAEDGVTLSFVSGLLSAQGAQSFGALFGQSERRPVVVLGGG